jgi:hypothetical protein
MLHTCPPGPEGGEKVKLNVHRPMRIFDRRDHLRQRIDIKDHL